MVIERLPSATLPVAAGIALRNLRNLASTKIYKMVPTSVQQTLNHTISLVSAIVDSRTPKVASALADAKLSK
eukprot:7871652-Lingulodinium_polyedra.AAC.1